VASPRWGSGPSRRHATFTRAGMHLPPRTAQRGQRCSRNLDLGPQPEAGQRREGSRPDRRQAADCPRRQRRAVLCPAQEW